MSTSMRPYLQHIHNETQYLLGRAQGLEKETFLHDETLKRAFVRSLEIIGEAVKQLPNDLKQRHTHLDWRAMAGMRDRLIHSYFGVDYDIVWDVVINKIPMLQREVEHILRQEGTG
ncbi:MAG: DUF86 domain-containing protein [Candidatus Schekmanbacteria bacterium]|nr:DUF86 domain-containing protein [Candidatus Schekmanbacteria bacterium]